jgi:site-specific recombinase XerD
MSVDPAPAAPGPRLPVLASARDDHQGPSSPDGATVLDAELVADQRLDASGAVEFEALLRDWLLGYSNPHTRLSYADALGLDRAWVQNLVDRPTSRPSPATRRRTPPPRRLGKHRSLAWFRWCDQHALHPLAATSTDVKRWQADMAAAEVAKHTRGHRLAVVSKLYRYLVTAGAVPANPATFDRGGLGLNTANDSSTTVVLTAEQVDQLLAAAGRPRRGLHPVMARRAAAIVAIFTLGLRVAELAGLRRADLHRTRGRRALRVTGKGNKTRIVYLSQLAADALDAYLAERDRWTHNAIPTRTGQVNPHERPLIATRDGHHLDPRDIWALIRRIARAAGPALADVADRWGPQALRHFYVTAAAEAGADMTHVQADVGHASVDTTNRIYNQAARHPDRSAVDIVETAILQARTHHAQSANTPPQDRPETNTPYSQLVNVPALANDDPVEQLLALQHLEHLLANDPAAVPDAHTQITTLLQRPDLHPRVTEHATALHARLTPTE